MVRRPRAAAKPDGSRKRSRPSTVSTWTRRALGAGEDRSDPIRRGRFGGGTRDKVGSPIAARISGVRLDCPQPGSRGGGCQSGAVRSGQLRAAGPLSAGGPAPSPAAPRRPVLRRRFQRKALNQTLRPRPARPAVRWECVRARWVQREAPALRAALGAGPGRRVAGPLRDSPGVVSGGPAEGEAGWPARGCRRADPPPLPER